MAWYKDASGKPVWRDDAPLRGVPIGLQDPAREFEAPQAAANINKTNADIRNAGERIGIDAAAERRQQLSQVAELFQKGLRPDGRGGVEMVPGWSPPVKAPELSAEMRGKALAQWNAAGQVDAQMDKVRSRFADGPGSTWGPAGLWDYLPTPDNENFDESANRLRPLLKNLLGVTGGENNAIAEMKLNLGAYIPNRWKTDKTNRTTMGDIRDVSRSAREQAVQTLGGIPDSNGRITPLPPGYKYGADPEAYGREKVVTDTVALLQKLNVPRDQWPAAIESARRKYAGRRAAKGKGLSAAPRKPASGGGGAKFLGWEGQ